MINYFNGTKKKNLTLSDDYLKLIKWYVDASFAVHPDFNNHTVVIVTMVQGQIQSVSSKHKLNKRIITEAGIVDVDCASV